MTQFRRDRWPIAHCSGRWTVPAAAAAVGLSGLGAVLAGCSQSPAHEPVGRPVDNPTISVSSPPTSEPPGTATTPVTVRADLLIGRTPAVAAVVAFVKAHAESIDAGRVTPSLVAATTPAQLARQRQVVAFAVASGFAVPTEPVLRVVRVLDHPASGESLAVCLWLPSTEYVDAETGQPPNGPVPAQWAPAVATVRLEKVTWSVDTLKEPDHQTTIRCGGNP